MPKNAFLIIAKNLFFYINLQMAASSSMLKADIITALDKLSKKRKDFERVEITDAIHRSVEKYEQLTPLFDYFYDQYKSLQDRVEKVENKKELLDSILEDILGYLEACVEASSIAERQLAEIVKRRSCFSVNQVRANLDLFNHAVKVIVLLKGDWPETEAPPEEALNRLHEIESDFFDLEDRFVHDYKFALLKSASSIQIRIEAHLLLSDFRLDIDSLAKDYPISVRRSDAVVSET